MEDLKKIQEFFSKPLNENKVTKEDFDKVVKILSKSKYPFTIMLVPKWDEIDIITGQDSPDEISDDISQRLNSAGLNWGGNSGITISGDSSNYSRREYSDIFKVNGGHKDYYEESVNEMDMNDPILMKMRAAKDKLAKMRAANAGDDGNDEFFDNAKKIAFLKKEREQLMRDMEQEAEPEGGPIADEYGSKLNRIDAAIAKLSGRKEMTYDQAIAEMKVGDKVTFKSGGDDMEIIGVRDMFASDLKAYRVKNADGETFEYSEDQLQLAEGESKMPTQDQVDKFFALTQNETHYLNSKPVAGQEKTFNKMEVEPWDEYDLSNWNSLVRKAKAKGKIKESLNPEVSNAVNRFIKAIAKRYDYSEQDAVFAIMAALKQRDFDGVNEATEEEENEFHKNLDKLVHKTFGHSSDEKKKSMAQELAETIKLGEGVIEEELCPKGKAYIKRRQAAGEKSSAYLSGRAVKVCKGQMSGRKKKK